MKGHPAMSLPHLSRALTVGALGLAAAVLSTPAHAAGHPEPRSGGSIVTNHITSSSSSNCASGSEAGCTTSVTVLPKPPTVNPGPFPATGPIDGTGTPGDPIKLVDGAGTTVCTATVLADGSWSCTASGPLGPGSVPLTPVDTSVSPDTPGSPTEVVFEAPVPLVTPGFGAWFALGTFALLGAGVTARARSARRSLRRS